MSSHSGMFSRAHALLAARLPEIRLGIHFLQDTAQRSASSRSTSQDCVILAHVAQLMSAIRPGVSC